MHLGVRRLVPAWGGSTAAVLRHLWWAGRGHGRQPMGAGPTEGSCQRHGAAPAPLPGSHLPFMWPWLRSSTSSSTPHCSLAPPPIVVLAPPLNVVLSLPHGGPMVACPQGAMPAQPRDSPCTSTGAGPQGPQWRRSPGWSSVPGRWCPTPAIAGARMPTPLACVPMQTCSQGAKQIGLVAGDSTGIGAIPAPASNRPESTSLEEQRRLLDLFP